MIWIRYTLLVLIIPAYVIALSRRWWTTIPLWLVSTSVMLTQFALNAQQTALLADGSTLSSLLSVVEMTKIMVVPVVVQLAVIWKDLQARAANQKERAQVLVASFEAGP
jgi:hypothetical protein